MSNPPTVLDYTTLAIAAVGAITGIAALGATWAQFMLSGPRLRVTTGTAYGGGPWLVSVTVLNIGRTPVSIGHVSLELDSKHHIPVSLEVSQGRAAGPAIPLRLEPYSEATWHLPARSLWATLQQQTRNPNLRAFAQYGEKKVYATKTIDIANIASFDE